MIMQRRIRVLRIIDRLNIGGPAIHCILLTAGLNRDLFATKLLSGRVGDFEGDMSYLARKYAVEPLTCVKLEREISLRKDLAALWRIRQIIRREQPDIVHTHKSKAGALGRIAAFSAGVPVIVHTFHGHIFHSYFGKLKSRLFIWIERLLGKITDTIIVISKRQYQEICEKYKIAAADKFAIVPLGFDFSSLDELDRYQGNLRRRYSIGADEITIGLIGRLTGVKNHRLFLRVAACLLRDYRQLRFLIIGDGELRELLMQEAKNLGILDKVVFTGWLRHPAEIYADTDIVALTSRNEGTPVTLIEAMYCGKAIVATDVGGVGDLLAEHRGLLVTDNDPDEFCQALSSLITDKRKRLQLGQNGRNYVRDHYHRRRLCADIENLYRRILNRQLTKK